MSSFWLVWQTSWGTAGCKQVISQLLHQILNKCQWPACCQHTSTETGVWSCTGTCASKYIAAPVEVMDYKAHSCLNIWAFSPSQNPKICVTGSRFSPFGLNLKIVCYEKLSEPSIHPSIHPPFCLSIPYIQFVWAKGAVIQWNNVFKIQPLYTIFCSVYIECLHFANVLNFKAKAKATLKHC